MTISISQSAYDELFDEMTAVEPTYHPVQRMLETLWVTSHPSWDGAIGAQFICEMG
ncbi:hypothetical protein IQ238_15660 [Pleurocapsales cyanobacterium LEGE 06147]|nr:hypothetical protein [Pleurocapsales cyanobacterium LEGE 06147]